MCVPLALINYVHGEEYRARNAIPACTASKLHIPSGLTKVEEDCMRQIFVVAKSCLYALAIAYFVSLGAKHAAAQSVQELLSKAEAGSKEIQKILRTLQSGDQATQYALVKALLENKDKAFVRVGREHALFSPDPVLQNMAVETIFRNTKQVRMVLTNPSSAEALKWLQVYGGGQDGQTGFVMMPVGNYDETKSCWTDPTFRGCRFTVVGNAVQFQMFANGGQKINRASSALTLQPDGRLMGPFSSGFGSGQLSIDLKE